MATQHPDGSVALGVHLARDHQRVAVREVDVGGTNGEDKARLVLDEPHDHVPDLLLFGTTKH